MQIGCVEDAIINKLAPIFDTKLATIQSLPAEIDEDMLKRILRLTPGVFVVFDGGADPSPGGSEAKMASQWSVVAITSNAGGEKLRRRGDPERLGAYDICEILIPALHRLTVPGIGTLVFQRLENRNSALLDNMGVCAYAPIFDIQINMPGFDYIASLAPFQNALVTTNLPGSNSNPSSVDDVSLPQPT